MENAAGVNLAPFTLKQSKPNTMKTKSLAGSLLVTAAIWTCGCSFLRQSGTEIAEPGETKVRLDQTPVAARQTIERELVGAQLEDIALEKRQGKTVYETDIIRDGHKWELVVGEDGRIISKIQEGGAAEEESAKPRRWSRMSATSILPPAWA
ncbi:MAG: hypothetical protein A3G75_07155 [Verrucomicrobia bacterium RIFCSPLOWO2_12_FULL_64_8]|nr:MAG: hypothetical protein A3G75_07155 [Verrucomicrobia bacterium RIFCSPLOWO2_12_FULL_64_8]